MVMSTAATILRFGINAIYHSIRPGEVTASAASSINSSQLQRRYSLENAVFATNTWKASDKVNITYGYQAYRISAF